MGRFIIIEFWVLLGCCCSWVSVLVLLLNIHLVSSQCWILTYMFAILMYWWARNPSRGPNNLYVYEPQLNLGRGCWPSKTGLSNPSPPPQKNPVIYYWSFVRSFCFYFMLSQFEGLQQKGAICSFDMFHFFRIFRHFISCSISCVIIWTVLCPTVIEVRMLNFAVVLRKFA